MATVTTNAHGKKKLVYKQDPDGVFRLKKLTEDDKLSTKSDKRTVDDYLNDLISCAYQVVDPNAPSNSLSEVQSLQSQESDVPEPGPPGPHSLDAREISANKVTKPRSKSSQNPHGAHLAPVSTNIPVPNESREISPGLQIDFHSSAPHSEEISSPRDSSTVNSPMKTTANMGPQAVNMAPGASTMDQNVIVERKGFQKFFQNLNTSLPIFHIPSFGLGLIIAIILNQMWPHLVYYTKIGFNYAKVGLVWGVILGIISWYAGVIKIQDVSSIRVFTEDLVTRITGKVRHPVVVPQSPELHQQPDYHHHQHPDTYEDHENDISIRDYVDDNTPSPPQFRQPLDRKDRSRSMARVKTRQKSLSPSRSPKQSRKSTVTNVVPFKPQVRNTPTTSSSSVPINKNQESNYRSPSVPNLPSYERNHIPPKLNRLHSTEPKSNYSRFVERTRKNPKHKNSNSIDSFDSSNLKYPPSAPSAIPGPPSHNHHHAPLPQLPDEDLPFINEVKLVNSDQDQDDEGEAMDYFNDHDTIGDLPHTFGGGGINRSNSTMSKKSVLGTRANYNRFLENAQYSDE